MTDDTNNETINNGADEQTAGSPPTNGSSFRRSSRFRLSKLALKELRETLRDRRTIVTLILMPLLVYPALSLVFKTYLLSNVGLLGNEGPIELQIAYGGPGDQAQIDESFSRFAFLSNQIEVRQNQEQGSVESDEDERQEIPGVTRLDPDRSKPPQMFAPFAMHKWAPIRPSSGETLESFVRKGGADLAIEIDVENRKRWELADFRIISTDSTLSREAAKYISNKIDQLNELDLEQRLRKFNIPTGSAVNYTQDIVGDIEEKSKSFPLASLIPLILVLMTITGAVYPAIDLTAGERERGTLETLMAAPVPRFGILFSKFLAVLTVAVMTAVLNLIGMFATIWAFQLDRQFGGGAFDLATVFQIFLLLILFAAFFSSLLLAVCSFAKSFKEAQVYLIPIILLSLGPGLIAMAPGMKLDGVYAVTPMVNIILLARDVLQQQVELVPAIMAVLSTALYAYLALRIAARIFGSDSILYAGSGSFAEMLQRPIRTQRIVPLMATLFCLLMLLPINFASIGYIGRMSGDEVSSVQLRFITMGVFTFLAFMVFPWIVARHQNANIKSAFGLNVPKPIYLLAGLLLGISMWPIVMVLIEGWHGLYGVIFGEAEQEAWHNRLVETTQAQVDRVRMVHPVVIAICLSIVPAVCEEWFFRGMLLRSLLKGRKVISAILISAAAFGLFHVLSNSVIAIDRLIPTTLIGIMLGFLAYKSNSIIPGIVLHAFNNACVVFVAYFQPQLSQYNWFPGENDPVPVSWVVAGLIVAVIGALLVWAGKGKVPEQANLILADDGKPASEEAVANA